MGFSYPSVLFTKPRGSFSQTRILFYIPYRFVRVKSFVINSLQKTCWALGKGGAVPEAAKCCGRPPVASIAPLTIRTSRI